MNDLEKLKEMTNQKIAYSIYQRKERDRMDNMKKICLSLCVCLLVIGSGVGVNAATGGRLAKNIYNAVKITMNGKEFNGDTYTDDNGDLWVKIKDKNGEFKLNKTELEKENLDVDIETQQTEDGAKSQITLKPSK